MACNPRSTIALVTAGLLGAGAPPLAAQATTEIGVSAVHSWASRAPVADGPGVEVTIGVRWAEPFALRLSGYSLRGATENTQVVCAGLVDPDRCQPESARARSLIRGASVGGTATLLKRSHVGLALFSDLHLAHVNAHTSGIESGRELAANRALMGIGAGVEASLIPRASWPLSLRAQARIDALGPITRDEVLDGYTPFNSGFSLRRVQLGLAWTLPSVFTR